MNWQRSFAGSALVLVFLITGCSQHALLPHDIRPFYNSNAKRVEGVRSALSASQEQPVRVLLVHGMGPQKPGYSGTLQGEIIGRLNLGLRPGEVVSRPIERGYTVTVFDGPQPLSSTVALPLSSLIRTTWIDGKGNPRLIFYEVLWAPPRDVIKNRFLACFESGVEADECLPTGPIQPNTDSQGVLNRFGKNRLMVGGFADASIVLSPIGDVLRDDIDLAMCTVAADVAGRDLAKARTERCDLTQIVSREDAPSLNRRLSDAKFVAITHSLGSFLLLDGQIRFAAERATNDADVARELAAFYLLDNKTMFMRANQVSLLHLARLRVACDAPPCPNRLVRPADDIFDAPPELSQMTTYVAFNDHNDLLGFELPPYLAERSVVGTLVNVSVRNGRWWIPGLLKNPLAAHSASDRNPAVIEAIVEGFALPPARR